MISEGSEHHKPYPLLGICAASFCARSCKKIGKHSKACIVQGANEALRFGTQTVMENLCCNFLKVKLESADPSPSTTPTNQWNIFCLQVHVCCAAPTKRAGSHTVLQLTARDSKFCHHRIPLRRWIYKTEMVFAVSRGNIKSRRVS